jgi:hypothetical protein
MSADGVILLVHGVAAGDDRHHATGANNVEGFPKKVIVDGASETRRAAVGGVKDRIVAERDVAHDHVEEVLRERRLLETLGVDPRVWVELGCDASGYGVEFHAGAGPASV